MTLTAGLWNGTVGLRFAKADWLLLERTLESFEIEIEGKSYTFAISPGFWNKCHEIRDCGEPVLENWLKFEGLIPWPKGNPPKFELEPLGGNEFRLKRIVGNS